MPLGVPPLPETQLLSKIAPEECLFYMSSAGMAAADAKSQNQTEQLLAEPEVQKAVGKVVDLIKAKAIGAIDAQLPPDVSSDDPKELMEAISQIIVYPAAVYISDIQLSPGGPNIRGGAAFRVGGDLEKFKGRIEQITRFLLHGQKTETLEISGEKWQSFKPAPI